MLEENKALIRAGAAVLPLRPNSKRPREENWTELPRYTWEEAQAVFGARDNIGIRLGLPSKIGKHYLHGIDFDLRDPDFKVEALDALKKLVGNLDDFDIVYSGSGLGSMHLYFVTDKTFRTTTLARSTGKITGADDKPHWKWEIVLGGTGRQFVLPPSIHPDTRRPYRWRKPPDFKDMAFVPSAEIEGWIPQGTQRTVRESDGTKDGLDEAIRDEPTGLPVNEILKNILANDGARERFCEDREGWLRIGMALHHETGGSDEGFEAWCDFSAESAKFERDYTEARWQSFGRRSDDPITLRSFAGWVDEPEDDADVGENRQETLEPVGRQSKKTRGEHHPPRPVWDDEDSKIAWDQEPVGPRTFAGQLKEFLHDLADLEDEVALDRPPAADPDAWSKKLDRTDDGRPLNVVTNIELIIQYDPTLAGIVAFNQFRQSVVYRRPFAQLTDSMFPLPVRDPVNGDVWGEAHDHNLRLKLATKRGKKGGYGLKPSEADLETAIYSAARNNPFHPIQQFLECGKWDGVKRLDTLFIDYLGTKDTPYYREVARNHLIAAVARIYRPGHKYDYAPILEGVEGKRKSTFIAILGKQWSGELNGNLHDRKRMVEQIRGLWVVELPELSALTRSGVAEVKAFLSSQKQIERMSYDKDESEHPRQCIFFGTTNEREYLMSDTGNRRFYPIICNIGSIDTDKLRREVDQIWFETYNVYREMRERFPEEDGDLDLSLSDEAAADEAFQMQTDKKIESGADVIAQRLAEFVDTPLEGEHDFATDGKKRYAAYITTPDAWRFICDGNGRDLDSPQTQRLSAAFHRLGWPPRRLRINGRQWRVHVHPKATERDLAFGWLER